jgi:hypothetical protein
MEKNKMASEIYKTIFSRKIENFKNIFSEDGEKIFKQRGRLIHPGEFGKYREEITKDLLRFILRPSVKVSDGFIITSDDDISTQNDIIIHDANLMPLLAENIVKMFPIEDVYAFVEVKSTLSKQDFINALKKLTDIKKLKKTYDGCGGNFGAFLVCKKLNIDIKEFDFNEVYQNTDRVFWFNGILSLDDMCINYQDKNGINMPYSIVVKGGRQQEVINPSLSYTPAQDDLRHIRNFFAMLSVYVNGARKEMCIGHDKIEYLGLSSGTDNLEF